jgi:uncharacterized membrane protein
MSPNLIPYGVGLIVLFFLYNTFFRRRGANRPIPTLILENYAFEKNPINPDQPMLVMDGRRPGLIARLFALLNIGAKCYLTVTRREVKVELNGIGGSTHFSAPLADITTSDYRLEKALWRLYLGILILIALLGVVVFGIGGSTTYNSRTGVYSSSGADIRIVLAGAVIAALLIYSYWQSKRLVVAFSTSEISNRYGLAFRPGSKVSYTDLLLAIQYVNQTMVDAHLPDAS